MDYLKNYYDYIDYVKTLNRSKSDAIYYEEHHILPKSLYPEYIKLPGNLVLLTAREHFLAHYLLTKIYKSSKMALAFKLMCDINNKKISAKAYERLKLKCNKYRSHNNEIFIEKASLIHNNEYDYSFVNYINSYTKVKLICSIHGEFYQSPSSHLNGSGCPKCRKFNKRQQTFLNIIKNIYGNKYDYNLINYVNNYTKIKLICSIHGEFTQRPDHLINGIGCQKCSRRDSVEIFIKKAKSIFGDIYDYSKFIYNDSYTKGIIICSIHGEFKKIPNNHLKGQGCPKCKHINYFLNKKAI